MSNLNIYACGCPSLICTSCLFYRRAAGVGFGIPTAAFMAAISLFIAGAVANLYVRVPPEGSPFKRIFRVFSGECEPQAELERKPNGCYFRLNFTQARHVELGLDLGGQVQRIRQGGMSHLQTSQRYGMCHMMHWDHPSVHDPPCNTYTHTHTHALVLMPPLCATKNTACLFQHPPCAPCLPMRAAAAAFSHRHQQLPSDPAELYEPSAGADDGHGVPFKMGHTARMRFVAAVVFWRSCC